MAFFQLMFLNIQTTTAHAIIPNRGDIIEWFLDRCNNFCCAVRCIQKEKEVDILFPTFIFIAVIAYGITAIVNPNWSWKRGFVTSTKVKDPNSGNLIMTKVLGAVLILIILIPAILVSTILN
ncbi:hypothetical protein HQN88_25140 [Paenibacillus qinlingensis]|nr:hypothetical protein [Paenibacillus qinlingensis]